MLYKQVVGETGSRVSVDQGRLDGLKLHSLPFRSPTPQSQFTGTSSYYRFRWHHPLITQLSPVYCSWLYGRSKMEISCNMVQTLRWKLKVTVRPMQVMLVIRTHLNQMSNHYWRLKKSRGTLLMSTMRPQIMRRQRRRRKDVLSAAVVSIKYF